MKIKIFIVALAASMLACMQSAAATQAPPQAVGEQAVNAPAANVAQAVKRSAATNPPAQAGKICGAWNVRPGPAARGAVIRWLYNGDAVLIYQVRDGWARIGAGEWVRAAAVCR